jgi:hypothetical protein
MQIYNVVAKSQCLISNISHTIYIMKVLNSWLIASVKKIVQLYATSRICSVLHTVYRMNVVMCICGHDIRGKFEWFKQYVGKDIKSQEQLKGTSNKNNFNTNAKYIDIVIWLYVNPRQPIEKRKASYHASWLFQPLTYKELETMRWMHRLLGVMRGAWGPPGILKIPSKSGVGSYFLIGKLQLCCY